MRVFVTGATGFIGQAVVKDLLKAGHQVLGLSRSENGAKTLTSLGAEVQQGSLDDLESLKQGASASDGVIHLAFIHDFTNMEAAAKADLLAIQTIGDVLAGSNKPLVITSGTLLLPTGRLTTEDDSPAFTTGFGIRAESEALTLSLAEKGVRSSVVRLPPTNHGDGDHGFMAMLIGLARQKGVSAYIGDGLTTWPATHQLDTSRVFQLAVEKGRAGSKFHAVAEEGVTIKEIATAIGEQLNIPVVSQTPEEAQEHFGWMASALSLDNRVSSAKTREQLGWSPVQKSLIADLKEGTYFKA